MRWPRNGNRSDAADKMSTPSDLRNPIDRATYSARYAASREIPTAAYRSQLRRSLPTTSTCI
uniref:Transposase n=1 Tax=Heterorhabditis bacteriophora TaxID=37862 RepID=A0A1I7WE45_HETBA